MPQTTEQPGGLGELAVIERIRSRAAGARRDGVATGIGDDCAVLRVPRGSELVVTTDFSLEGRHFRRDWHSAASAGHRCLARGLSDVAAMGGRPLAAFLSLALPRHFDPAWLDAFMEGLLTLAAAHAVELAGGDTAQAPAGQILADIVCVGAVRRGRALLRDGARAGDVLYVTGSLGGAAVELAGLARGAASARSAAEAGYAPQTFPEPRIASGLLLSGRRLATSCMDLSDGLATDLRHLCQASGVDAELELDRLPLAPGATLEQALAGGEDYELLFTARPETRVPRKLAGVPVSRIGRVTGMRGASAVIHADGELLTLHGWEHFGQEEEHA